MNWGVIKEHTVLHCWSLNKLVIAMVRGVIIKGKDMEDSYLVNSHLPLK